jgi:uncharacterized protein
MKARTLLVIAASGGALAVAAAGAPTAPLPRVLVVMHAAAFEHDVVRRPDPERPSVAEQVVTDLGRDSSAFTATVLQSATELQALTPAAIRAFQAILFYTTGSLPLSVESRAALFAHVRDGAGFVGVHSADDTWDEVAEYGEMLGGKFNGHPWHQRVRVLVEDTGHPATAHLGPDFWVTDEIHTFRSWSRGDLHVLMRLDMSSVDARRGTRSDGDYALAWTRTYGKGRVFYTALGHQPEVWADPRFRRHLQAGILWALGLR